MSDYRNTVGLAVYALASAFLLVSLLAAVRTARTKRFSSGLHIVPTILAVVGSAGFGVSWKALVAVAVLDIATLLVKLRLPTTPAEPPAKGFP